MNSRKEVTESVEYIENQGFFGDTFHYILLPESVVVKSQKIGFQRSFPLLKLEKVQLKIAKDKNSLILYFQNEKPLTISSGNSSMSQDFILFTDTLHHRLSAMSSRAQFIQANKGHVILGICCVLISIVALVYLSLSWFPQQLDAGDKSKWNVIYVKLILVILVGFYMIWCGWPKKYNSNIVPKKFYE